MTREQRMQVFDTLQRDLRRSLYDYADSNYESREHAKKAQETYDLLRQLHWDLIPKDEK